MQRWVALVLLFSAVSSVASEGWMVCYFSSWAVYRPGVGRFDVDDIDPALCTHAVFGFAGLSNQTWTIEVLDPWNENCPDDSPSGNGCAYQRFTALKQQNPKLKTILAVGGWNEGSVDYSAMVSDPAKRATFIQSSIELVEKEGFDGLDIDWEYPNQRGGVDTDPANFVTLLDEFRVEFDKRGLLMTAALANGNPTSISTSYNDVSGIVRNLDVMSIMTYDFHGAWENFTHHNSPLCGYPGDEGDFVWFNVEASIDYWLEMGAPPEKLVMGVALYGRCFTLDDIEDHGMLANASQPGDAGPYTRLPGTQGWNEICIRIEDTSDCTVVHDPLLHEPYMYCRRDNLWCGYEDEDSAKLKAQFAKSKGLAGIVFWTIDTDDFQPTCGTQKFDLINRVKNTFNDPTDVGKIECGSIPVVTTPIVTTEETTTELTTTKTTRTTERTTTDRRSSVTAETPVSVATLPTDEGTPPPPPPTTTTESPPPPPPTTTTESPPPPPPTTTTESPAPPTLTTTVSLSPTTTTDSPTTPYPVYPEKPDCALDTDTYYYAHPNCNKYWWCVSGDPILMLCPPGTYYNTATELCDFPYNVDTSQCEVWVCAADGDTFAGAECDEYYQCEHGTPLQRFCNPPLYYNADAAACDYPENINTDTCNIP